MEAMDSLGLLASVLRDLQPVGHRDALDDEHAIVVHDLADRLGLQAVPIRLNVTRLQRASEGAGQSPARGRDDVVERGGVGRKILGAHPVVLGHL
jgi:hypothetical protein